MIDCSVWHVEISSRCTLRCPRCPRQEQGLAWPWVNKDISLDQFKNFFTPQDLRQVSRLILCGDMGDPIYNNDLPAIVAYAKSTNPEISLQITTNGSYRKHSWWRDLVANMNSRDSITFSIDGWDQHSNQQYRVNSDWSSMMQGILAARSNADICLIWSCIVFRFNQHRLDEIQQLARNMGFNKFSLVHSMKFGTNFQGYLDDQGQDLLEPDQHWISRASHHDPEIIHFDHIGSKHTQTALENHRLQQQRWQQLRSQNTPVIPACWLDYRGFYIRGDGAVLPCVWTATPNQNNSRSIYGDRPMPYMHQMTMSEYSAAMQDLLLAMPHSQHPTCEFKCGSGNNQVIEKRLDLKDRDNYHA